MGTCHSTEERGQVTGVYAAAGFGQEGLYSSNVEAKKPPCIYTVNAQSPDKDSPEV